MAGNSDCIKCGDDATCTLRMCFGDEALPIGKLCDSCLDDFGENADEYKREFEWLIAAGVSRAEANVIMIEGLDHPGVMN